MLRLMLSGHSRIHIPTETHFIADLVREIPLTAGLSPAQIASAVEIITGYSRWDELQILKEEFRRWVGCLVEPRLVDVINLIYQDQARRAGKRRFGDKTPDHIRLIPQLSVLYPGAKFIHLIRDGRDVAISHIKLGWGRYYDRKEFEWTVAMRLRREYAASAYADQILEVAYEDLVAEPEATLRKICAFIGEEFEPAMLDWGPVVNLLPEQVLSTLHAKLLQPISNDGVASWRSTLAAWECFAMEACLRRDLVDLGYRLRFSDAGWRPLLALSGWLLTVSAPLLKRAIPYLQRRNCLSKTIYI